MSKRRIKISIPMITEAMQSKEQLEGFAFALLVKIKFTDSHLKGSVRDQKKVLGIGQNVLARAKANAIKFGYIQRETDGRLFALRVRRNNPEYRYTFDFEGTEKKNVIRNEELVRAMGKSTRLSDVVFFLRGFVIRNRVRQQNAYSDLVKEVTCGSKAHRAKARRKLRSMWKRIGRTDHTPYNNLSLGKMQTISQSSRYTVRNIVNTMVADGTMQRKVCNIPAKYFFKGSEFQTITRKRGEKITLYKSRMAAYYSEANLIYRETGHTGYIHQLKGCVFVRMADLYKDTSCAIRKHGSFRNVPKKERI